MGLEILNWSNLGSKTKSRNPFDLLSLTNTRSKGGGVGGWGGHLIRLCNEGALLSQPKVKSFVLQMVLGQVEYLSRNHRDSVICMMWGCGRRIFAKHTVMRILRLQSPIREGEREN